MITQALSVHNRQRLQVFGQSRLRKLCYSRPMFRAARAREKSTVQAQKPVLPEIPSIAGHDIAYAQRVASGGDVLDLAVTPSQRAVLMLLDICGRNTEAAGANLQQVFRSRVAELFVPDGNDSEALTLLVLDLNREILRAGEGTRCTAAFVGCLDPNLGTLWYVNAGHTPGIVHDGEVTRLNATGVPLGLFSHAVHDAQVHVLAPGTALALVSKGVVEHDEFGLEHAGELIRRRAAMTAAQLSQELLQASEQVRRRPHLRRHTPQDKTAVALIRA
jgi:serine phosphatase RsbU (regulator of sigma subunit)